MGTMDATSEEDYKITENFITIVNIDCAIYNFEIQR